MTNRRQFVQALGGAAALGALHPLAALAQAVQQAKIYYGFPAGSAGDSVARRVAEKLGDTPYSKINAVVENKPGAGGRIALDTLKGSPADGSVLCLAQASALSTYPHIYTKLSYGLADFAPVSIGAVMTHGLAVGPVVPASVKTLKDYIAWAKANPGQASYGSPGAGSTPHFLGALLGLNTGTDLRHVPYRGSLPAINDVVGGQIASSMTPVGDYLPFAKAGKLRVLATSGAQRAAYLPDVPTFTEQGFPEIVADEWFGFFAPAKTPAAVIAAASTAIQAALKDKAVADGLLSVGLVAHGSSPEDMKKSLQSEYERWGPLVKKIGFTAES
ncbi:Bug family tripartite tricarboxylate transporter substrate binding protein [Variovorax paradoxus]|jgi:tripartite-type tricarboxylate transporter receptor subunit TctC|uniref:Bug family tripartite tricarboxylate transporter substrate binding protein n=1 Tax=Variovorax paradoxus TaxID=34073 RepID=UPI0029C76683|nr:Bug family tripartite tricarboxylate transporter substrate binding protein [Variovorax paradoxus]WPH13261.1 Bug family tripartite tricarboxylate transporter substrate binding protein [Variovorax paradoxus]WPH19752.1 Bug family tripartite tricarboxylate transporter substrate binding protein [Variovorax paradoxus]